MQTITVKTNPPYTIHIRRGLCHDIRPICKELTALGVSRIAILSDETVASLYAEKFTQGLSEHGFTVSLHTFAPGENHKTLSTVERLITEITKENLTRGDLILALGGGITGDIAGFIAGIYQRGMRFVQVPTTLLSAVDASVGGKTGVNLGKLKNMVGIFWQPAFVFCDSDFFKTLSPELYADGMAEVIKYGALFSSSFLEDLGKTKPLSEEDMLATCIALKARVVAEDERDTGTRQLLNFGHTFGHAIETLSRHSISHGRAVAQGMLMACRFAEFISFSVEPVAKTLSSLLEKYHLPTCFSYTFAKLLSHMLSDKKRSTNEITLILPYRLGECRRYTLTLNDFMATMRHLDKAEKSKAIKTTETTKKTETLEAKGEHL